MQTERIGIVELFEQVESFKAAETEMVPDVVAVRFWTAHKHSPIGRKSMLILTSWY